MAEKLRVAVVGTGFGTIVHIPAFQSCAETEVVAVCSAREERAREAAEQFGVPSWTTDYDALAQRSDIDIISISSPPFTHLPMGMAALDAGKHVLLEKPMAVNVAECLALLDNAEARGLVHMVAHEFRWNPSRAYIGQLIREGYIGQLRHVNITLFVAARGGSLGRRTYGWAAQREMGGGMLFAIGSHYIDGLRSWFGDFSGVLGSAFVQVPERDDPASGERVMASADDGFHLHLRFRAGGWASMAASMAAPFGPGTRIEIYGTEGTLVSTSNGFNPPPQGGLLGARTGEPALHELPIPAHYTPFEDNRDDRMASFRLMIDDFAAAVRSNGKPIPPTFYDGLRVQEVLNGVFTSMETGRWVDIPE